MFWNNLRSTIEYHLKKKKLLDDHKAFDEFVYTDIDTAVKELHRRQQDPQLKKKVEKFFKKVGIPEPFLDPKGRLVLFRQLATPNIEASRFLIASDSIGIEPLFLEYYKDKFTPNNYTKKYLGKLAFYAGTGKKGGHIVEYLKIIDFNNSNGKKIEEVKTLKEQSLIDFHHSLFSLQGHSHINKEHFFDASSWFKTCGGKASSYYYFYIALMIQNGILFENFMPTDKSERDFVNKVFLKNFILIKNYFNLKPIIVALNPTEIENEEFWLCYSHLMLEKIKQTLI